MHRKSQYNGILALDVPIYNSCSNIHFFMINKCLIAIVCLLLLPVIGWGQSEVTRRVSAEEMGYRGRVKTVQCTEFCNDAVHKFFRTTAEAYNEQGLRTDMSISDNLYQTNYHYEYDGSGQLVYYVATFSDGEKDSIVFHYNNDGCLSGYEEYMLSADPTEGNSVTDFIVTCDTQCRVLMCTSVWYDTMRYDYDSVGRIRSMNGHGLPDGIKTFHYDKNGRLERIRMGAQYYEDSYYRYDANGDTVETWQTNWERFEKEKGAHEVGEHKHFTFSEYDDHGNWKKADVRVVENRKPHVNHVVRTITYYE